MFLTFVLGPKGVVVPCEPMIVLMPVTLFQTNMHVQMRLSDAATTDPLRHHLSRVLAETVYQISWYQDILNEMLYGIMFWTSADRDIPTIESLAAPSTFGFTAVMRMVLRISSRVFVVGKEDWHDACSICLSGLSRLAHRHNWAGQGRQN
jgi:hypothetical protein